MKIFQIFQSPKRSRPDARQDSGSSSYPPEHDADIRQSLARVTEIQKFAKVLPHCSSAVRLNHLSRCSPLQATPRSGQRETFENLYHRVSNLAVTNSNKQLPLPTNNYPRIPRKKNKKSSSKRPTANSKLPSAPAIVVSHPPTEPETRGNQKTNQRRNPLLNHGDTESSAPTHSFNFVIIIQLKLKLKNTITGQIHRKY